MIGIYSRVSTGLQANDGTSLDGQIELCIKKGKELGFNESNMKIYREEGYTGEDIDRPQMNILRQDIVDGLITHLIITHPDRLSRDMTDKLIINREFEKYDVQLIFVDTEYKNTPEGQLFFNMQSAIAQYELAQIKKRTTRGRLKVVEKDKKVMPMRVSPFGYDLVDGQLIINEEESKFVKMIYQWYAFEHLTMRQIGEKLYELGAIPKRGESKNWSASSIRRVLTSEIYKGKYYYNRRKTQKIRGEKTQGGNPKKTYEMRDESEWLEIDIPAIIDNDLWEITQDRRAKNTLKSGNVKHEYLLKSMIRCGHCGRLYQSTTYSGRVENGEKKKYPIYRCPNKYPKKYGEGIIRCETDTIRADHLDTIVWDTLVDILSDSEKIKEVKSNDTETFKDDWNNMMTLLQNQISQKEKEKEKLKILFMKDLISEEELEKDMSKIKKETDKLNKELYKYQDKITHNDKYKLSVEQLESFASNFQNQIIDADISFNEKRRIIETSIDEIVLSFEDDKIILATNGLLGNLFNLYSSSQPQNDINTNKGIGFTIRTALNITRGDKSEKLYHEIESKRMISLNGQAV